MTDNKQWSFYATSRSGELQTWALATPTVENEELTQK